MSFAFSYFFESKQPLHDVADAFNRSLSANLRPQEEKPTSYVGKILAIEFWLTHNWVDPSNAFNDYPFILRAKIFAPDNDLLFIHTSLFFSTIYVMYRRMKITKGVWVGDSHQTIAAYDYRLGDRGWQWYDLTNRCAAGDEDEFVENYLTRIFPR